MKWIKFWLLPNLIVLTGCCVSMPRYQQTENLMEAPSVNPSVCDSLDAPFFCVGDWPKENWWEMFGSKELNAFIVEALFNNPSIHEAESRVQLAYQTSKLVKSRLFPWIFFNASDDWQYLSKNGLYRALNPDIPLNAHLLEMNFTLKYNFDFWGKNHQLYYASLGWEKAEEAENAQVEIVIATSLAQAYFTLKTNLLKKQLLEKNYKVYKAVADLSYLLKDKALLSKLDPLLNEEKALSIFNELIDLDAEIETNKHLINILMGRGPDSCLFIEETFHPLPCCFEIPAELSIDLIARRPDLTAQIWRVQALAHEVGAALADFFPDVNLTAMIGLESVFYSKLLEARSITAGAKPALHLPIFTAGAIRANVQAKKAEFDQAVFLYNRLLLQSAREVTDQLAFANSIFYQNENQNLIVEKAQERLEITNLRKASGLDSSFATLEYEKELLKEEIKKADLLFWKYTAVLQLIQALGGGFHSDYGTPLLPPEVCCE